MKKIVICNIPMKDPKWINKLRYISNDQSLPVSEQAYMYPINSFLSQTITKDDELKVILLIKNDGKDFYKSNMDTFMQEMDNHCKNIGLKVEYVPIDTTFDQKKSTHEELMKRLIDEIDINSHIMIDITYGPKDLPVVIFTALNFAEKFLNCEIDNIIYGQAEFDESNKVKKGEICDMTPLYYLNSVIDIIQCNEPSKAKQMLNSLLEL